MRTMQVATERCLARYGLQLAVSPLSWTNDVLEDLGDDTPVEQCLREAAEVGYQGVELGRKFPREPQALKWRLAAHELALAGGWYSGFLAERDVDTELAAVEDHARLLAAMGTRAMVYGECGLMPGDAPLDEPLSATPVVGEADWSAYGERLTGFARQVDERFGVEVAYHPHLMMAVETEAEIDRFMAVTGEAVGLLLDTGHVAAAGGDVARVIERYGRRINHIHLKDVRRSVLERVRAGDLSFNEGVRSGMFTVPGDGDLDFGAAYAFAAGAGYRGWLVVEAEQDPVKAPPLAAVTRARRHVLDYFGGGTHA